MAPRKKITLTKEQLLKHARPNGTIPISKIAQKLGVSPSFVSNAAADFGLKTTHNQIVGLRAKDLKAFQRPDGTLDILRATEAYETSHGPMLRLAKRLGFEIGRQQVTSKVSNLTRENAQKFLGADGRANIKEIMDAHGAGFYTTRKHLEKIGIQTRGPGEQPCLKEVKINLPKRVLKAAVRKDGTLNARLAARKLRERGINVSHQTIINRAPMMGFLLQKSHQCASDPFCRVCF